MPPNLPHFSADIPLSDPAQDRLGYAPFAKHLAKAICEMEASAGLVVAIHGQWGMGKSTLLNFLMHYLRQPPLDGIASIVEYNPWWYAGPDELVKGFFAQLSGSVAEGGEGLRELRGDLALLAEAVSHLPQIGQFAAMAATLLRGAPQDLGRLRDKVVTTLEKHGRRTVVVVDDIDRLTTEETCQLFRVIKAVANFPQVVYVLAFDRARVARTLGRQVCGGGEDYLKKIVQVPFDLPEPDRILLRHLSLEQLSTVFRDSPPSDDDKTYFYNIYADGIEPMLRTPRDVVRLVNAITITLPLVKGEIHPVDFVAIQTLRVFCPDAYDVVRGNQESFTARWKWDADSETVQRNKELKAFHTKWVTSIQDAVLREAVQRLLARMFPILRCVWKDVDVHVSRSESELTKHMHVACDDHFQAYFRLSLPSGAVGRVEASRLLDLAATDLAALKKRLLEMAAVRRVGGTSRVPSLLQTLRTMPEGAIPPNTVEPLIKAFLDVGDDLWQPGDQPIFILSFGNNSEMAGLILALLRRVLPAGRYPLLRDATKTGAAVCMPIHLMRSLREDARNQGEAEGGAPEFLLLESQLSELDKDILAKIEAKARDFSLLNVPDVHLALNYWRVLVRPDDKHLKWLRDVVADDNQLVKFLAKTLTRGFHLSGDSRVREPHYRLDPEKLKEFLPPDVNIDRIRQLAASGRYSGDDQLALDTYVSEYELRLQGLDPDGPPARARSQRKQIGGGTGSEPRATSS